MDDGKINSEWKSYVGSAVEGAVIGGTTAATAGMSLWAEAGVIGVTSFVGNASNQYISKGEVNWKEAAFAGVIGGATTIGGNYVSKFVSKTKTAQAIVSKSEQLLEAAKQRSKQLTESVMSRVSGRLDTLKTSFESFADNISSNKLVTEGGIPGYFKNTGDFTGTINDPQIKVKLAQMNNSSNSLTKAEINGISEGVGEATSINPNEIRFSQTSVNDASEIIGSMKQNGWKGDPIDVVRMPDGKLTTIDNTRVLSARYAEIDVKANVYNHTDLLPEDLIQRFTTKKGVPQTWGDAINLRIGKQSSAYRKLYPNRSNITGWDGK